MKFLLSFEIENSTQFGENIQASIFCKNPAEIEIIGVSFFKSMVAIKSFPSNPCQTPYSCVWDKSSMEILPSVKAFGPPPEYFLV